MLKTFDCPKCGAPVTYERNEIPGAAEPRIKCNYCGSTLIGPDEAHGQPARVVHIDLRSITRSKSSRLLWVLVAIPLVIGLVIVLAMVGVLAPVFYSINRTVTKTTNEPSISRTLRGNEKPADDFARVLLKFGEEGIGPGMFKDARSIAVDGAGRIYVGEYTGGRIQVFDPAGKFLTQWSIGDRKTILRGLAADRKGTVYVVEGGKIHRYQGENGTQLQDLPYDDGYGFDDATVGADGSVIAAWYRNRDDIVRFNSNGQVANTIRAAISGASGDSELNTRVAVDGLGNVYALGHFNGAVFKFSPEGKFMNQFGGQGEQPGQFRAAQAIAVDGKGRVFVSDIKGIQVFDGNGRYLRMFKSEGGGSGMVFNDNNELFVVGRTRVFKYTLLD
jgi:DNA-binding beta-propeller fold protein YncE